MLDWRLGMDVIKLMVDSNYQMGYDDLANTPYGDLADVFNKLGERVQKAHPAGDVVYTPNDGHNWRTGYFVTENSKKEHLVHMFRLQRNVKASPIKHQSVQAPQQPVQNKRQPGSGVSIDDNGCGPLG